jgi:hypothetical protein
MAGATVIIEEQVGVLNNNQYTVTQCERVFLLIVNLELLSSLLSLIRLCNNRQYQYLKKPRHHFRIRFQRFIKNLFPFFFFFFFFLFLFFVFLIECVPPIIIHFRQKV